MPGSTIERKKRRGATTTSQDNQSVETTPPTRPALPTPPHSEPIMPATRNPSGLVALNSTASTPSSERGSLNAPLRTRGSDRGSYLSTSESITNTIQSGTTESPSINVVDVTDPSSPPETPCPTCHRRSFDTNAGSRSPSPIPSPNSFLSRSDSDTSLDLSSLSLADDPVPSVHFQRKNAGPLARILIDLKVFQTIRHEALDPSSAKQGEDGYIYIAEDKDQPGHVKIGRTFKWPQNRNIQLSRCRKICTELVEGQNFATVPYYKRLENIIFADLWNERRFFLCECRDQCSSSPKLTRHGEWFHMSKKDALARVALWQDWMRRNPYDDRGVLKPEWQKRIQALQANKTYEETVEKEHASGKYWETFMKEFEKPTPFEFTFGAART